MKLFHCHKFLFLTFLYIVGNVLRRPSESNPGGIALIQLEKVYSSDLVSSL